jgi:hypothetical protein
MALALRLVRNEIIIIIIIVGGPVDGRSCAYLCHHFMQVGALAVDI